MKKRIFTLSVVSLLAIAATGCSSDVTKKTINGEDVIVSIKKDGEEITYTANEVFSDYLDTTDGASAAFSAVYDVLVGAAVETTQELDNQADNRVTELENNARTSAQSNGTTYKEELSNALDSAGAEDVDEYREIQLLSLKKTKFEDNYYDSQMYEGKMDSTTTITPEGDQYELSLEYLENENPYHVRHILIETSSSGDSFLPDAETLTEDEAIKLGNTIKNLASDSSTFGQVALDFSDDSSSTSYGNLNELMGRSTSYVNEFKFAIFQYDAYLNTDLITDGATSLAIPNQVDGVSETTEEVLKDNIQVIPYAVADELIEYADITKDKNGDNYKEGSEKYFPRNYLFDKYFSNHGLNFIVRGESNIQSSNFRSIETINTVLASTFESLGYTGSQRDVLCDEKGNPILVTRAGSGSSDSGYQGIHFIVIENSPLINENRVENGAYTAGWTYSLTEELKYYSVDVPKTSDDVSNDKRYVTFIDSKQTDYNQRANEIISAVKGYDSNINFRLYEKLKEELATKNYTVTINETISNAIDNYIESTRNKTLRNTETTYEDSWKTYIRQLLTQDQFAKYAVDVTTITSNFDVPSTFGDVR